MQGGVPEPAMPNVTTGNKAAVPESANPTTVSTARSLCYMILCAGVSTTGACRIIMSCMVAQALRVSDGILQLLPASNIFMSTFSLPFEVIVKTRMLF